MWRDTWWELVKLRHQRKNAIVLVGHVVLMALVILGLKLARFDGPMARATARVGLELREYIDGLFFARSVYMPTVLMILPIFICTIAGDLVAGEMQDGSLKLHAARPRPRHRILGAKFLAMAVAAGVYSLWFATTSLLVGWLFFGRPGTQIILLFHTGVATDFCIMDATLALWRYALWALYHMGSILALGSIALFFSTLFNRMTSATVAGLTVYFVSYILEGLPWLQEIKPYLLSRAMNGSIYVWMASIPTSRLAHSLAVLGIYVTLFLGAALCVFQSKDIR